MDTTKRSAVLFVIFAATGFGLLLSPVIDRVFVGPFIHVITWISGAVIDLFGGSVTVLGDILSAPTGGFAVRVDNGCSGLDAVILLAAACLAFPTTWRLRMVGVLACSAAILLVNIIRIISLFYLGQYSMAWFNWAHNYAWDILILIDGVIAYMLWIRFVFTRDPVAA